MVTKPENYFMRELPATGFSRQFLREGSGGMGPPPLLEFTGSLVLASSTTPLAAGSLLTLTDTLDFAQELGSYAVVLLVQENEGSWEIVDHDIQAGPYEIPQAVESGQWTWRVWATATAEGFATRSVASNSLTATLEVIPVFEAPVNTVAPVLTPGAFPEVGSVLSASSGTWTGSPAPTITYQWRADGEDILEATSSTYETQTSDIGKQVGCQVRGTNVAGTAAELTATIRIGPALPVAAWTSTDGWVVDPYTAGGLGTKPSVLTGRVRGRNFSQDSSDLRPEVVEVEGRRAIRFDGANDIMVHSGTNFPALGVETAHYEFFMALPPEDYGGDNVWIAAWAASVTHSYVTTQIDNETGDTIRVGPIDRLASAYPIRWESVDLTTVSVDDRKWVLIEVMRVFEAIGDNGRGVTVSENGEDVGLYQHGTATAEGTPAALNNVSLGGAGGGQRLGRPSAATIGRAGHLWRLPTIEERAAIVAWAADAH